MKIMHLADVHIGKIVNGYSMIEDQKYILNQIYHIILEEQVDVVLIAGDIYDRSIPTIDGVSLFDDFLCKLKELDVKTYIIGGNHDSMDRLSFGNQLFVSNNIYISGGFNGKVDSYELEDEYGKVNLFMLPFFKPALARHLYENENIESYEDGVRVAIKSIKLDKNKRNILVTHQFVISDKEDVAVSDSESILSVGGTDKVNADIFKDFDYVALGHIHKCQRVGKETVRYAGSPLKYSFSEANYNKSVPILDIREKDDLEVKLVPIKPIRDLRLIKGTMNEIIDSFVEGDNSNNDYVGIVFTGTERYFDPINTIKKYFPNTMQIQYENEIEMEKGDLTKIEIKSINPIDVMKDFYEFNRNQVMPCEIEAAVEKIYEEAKKRCIDL